MHVGSDSPAEQEPRRTSRRRQTASSQGMSDASPRLVQDVATVAAMPSQRASTAAHAPRAQARMCPICNAKRPETDDELCGNKSRSSGCRKRVAPKGKPGLFVLPYLDIKSKTDFYDAVLRAADGWLKAPSSNMPCSKEELLKNTADYLYSQHHRSSVPQAQHQLHYQQPPPQNEEVDYGDAMDTSEEGGSSVFGGDSDDFGFTSQALSPPASAAVAAPPAAAAAAATGFDVGLLSDDDLLQALMTRSGLLARVKHTVGLGELMQQPAAPYSQEQPLYAPQSFVGSPPATPGTPTSIYSSPTSAASTSSPVHDLGGGAVADPPSAVDGGYAQNQLPDLDIVQDFHQELTLHTRTHVCPICQCRFLPHGNSDVCGIPHSSGCLAKISLNGVLGQHIHPWLGGPEPLSLEQLWARVQASAQPWLQSLSGAWHSSLGLQELYRAVAYLHAAHFPALELPPQQVEFVLQTLDDMELFPDLYPGLQDSMNGMLTGDLPGSEATVHKGSIKLTLGLNTEASRRQALRLMTPGAIRRVLPAERFKFRVHGKGMDITHDTPRALYNPHSPADDLLVQAVDFDDLATLEAVLQRRDDVTDEGVYAALELAAALKQPMCAAALTLSAGAAKVARWQQEDGLLPAVSDSLPPDGSFALPCSPTSDPRIPTASWRVNPEGLIRTWLSDVQRDTAGLSSRSPEQEQSDSQSQSQSQSQRLRPWPQAGEHRYEVPVLDAVREAKASQDTVVALDLSHKHVGRLPVELCGLSGLKKLDVSFNHLESLKLTHYRTSARNNQDHKPESDSEAGAGAGVEANADADVDGQPTAESAAEDAEPHNLRHRATPVAHIGLLSQLEELNAKHNVLTSLPLQLGQLRQLQRLYLGGNQLTTIAERRLGQLRELRVLQLEENPLVALPEDIGGLMELTELSCHATQLTHLPKSIVRLQKLRLLLLFNNRLTLLPAEVGSLVRLEELVVCNNKLVQLPQEVGGLVSLKMMHINNNELSALPDDIGKLALLEHLMAHNNRLTALPPSIGSLANLTRLSLKGNRLKQLPDELCQLRSLKWLMLTQNQLCSLPANVGQLVCLEILDLSGNHLASLPSQLSLLGQLRQLLANNNRLTELPAELGQLTQLHELHLNGNLLSEVPSQLGSLTELQILNLAANRLTFLPSELGNLAQLHRLAVEDNNLRSLPVSFRALTQLTELGVAGNPLAAQGLPQDLDAAQQLLQHICNNVVFQRVKVNTLPALIVGAPGAGKTSLLRALSNKRVFFNTSATSQPEHAVATVALPGNEGGEVSLSLTELGGCASQHGSLQLMLASRCVVVLAVNFAEYNSASDEAFARQAQPWLEALDDKTSGRHHLVVVATHVPEKASSKEIADKCEHLVACLQAHEQQRFTCATQQLQAVRSRIEALRTQLETAQLAEMEAMHAELGQLQEQTIALTKMLAHRPQLPARSTDIVCLDTEHQHSEEEEDDDEDDDEEEELAGLQRRCMRQGWRKHAALRDKLSAAVVDLLSEEAGGSATVPWAYQELQTVLENEALQRPVLFWHELEAIVNANVALQDANLTSVPGLLARAVAFLHDTGCLAWFRGCPTLAHVVFLNLAWVRGAISRVVVDEATTHEVKFRLGVKNGYDDELSLRRAMDAWLSRGHTSTLPTKLLRHMWHDLLDQRRGMGGGAGGGFDAGADAGGSDDSPDDPRFVALLHLLQLLQVALPVTASGAHHIEALAVARPLPPRAPNSALLDAMLPVRVESLSSNGDVSDVVGSDDDGHVEFLRQLRLEGIKPSGRSKRGRRPEMLPAALLDRLRLHILASNLPLLDCAFWRQGLVLMTRDGVHIRMDMEPATNGRPLQLLWRVRTPRQATPQAHQAVHTTLLGLGHEPTSKHPTASSIMGQVLFELFGPMHRFSDGVGQCPECSEPFPAQLLADMMEHGEPTSVISCAANPNCDGCRPLKELVPLSPSCGRAAEATNSRPYHAVPLYRQSNDRDCTERLQQWGSRAIVCVPSEVAVDQPWHVRVEQLWDATYTSGVDVYMLCEAGVSNPGCAGLCCAPRMYTLLPGAEWIERHAFKMRVLSLVVRHVAMSGLTARPPSTTSHEPQPDLVRSKVEQVLGEMGSPDKFLARLLDPGRHTGLQLCELACHELQFLVASAGATSWEWDQAGLVFDAARLKWLCPNHKAWSCVVTFHAGLQHSPQPLASARTHPVDAWARKKSAKDTNSDETRCQRCRRGLALGEEEEDGPRSHKSCGACPGTFCEDCFAGPDGKVAVRTVGGKRCEVCRQCVALGYFEQEHEDSGETNCRLCKDSFGVFKWPQHCLRCQFKYCSSCFKAGRGGAAGVEKRGGGSGSKTCGAGGAMPRPPAGICWDCAASPAQLHGGREDEWVVV